ncbi:MAG: TadE/TadG family type IV pilus assembly protein [Actinomycetota bacterium]
MNAMDVIKRRLAREDGVAALEFAIVAMVFLVLLFGILTYGFVFGLDQSMNHAAEEGARAAISKVTEADAITHAHDTALSRLSWLGGNIHSSDIVATVADCPNDITVRCITVTITYPWSTRPVIPNFPGLPTPTQMQAVAVVELT